MLILVPAFFMLSTTNIIVFTAATFAVTPTVVAGVVVASSSTGRESPLRLLVRWNVVCGGFILGGGLCKSAESYGGSPRPRPRYGLNSTMAN